jgi:hypothetical protein
VSDACVLDGREIAVVLPGSAWLGILTSHVEWAITTPLEQMAEGDPERVARQLRLLLAAAADGLSPAQDDLITEVRQLVDIACEVLGHVPDAEDTRLASQLVIRHEVLQSLIRKLAIAAGAPSPHPRQP